MPNTRPIRALLGYIEEQQANTILKYRCDNTGTDQQRQQFWQASRAKVTALPLPPPPGYQPAAVNMPPPQPLLGSMQAFQNRPASLRVYPTAAYQPAIVTIAGLITYQMYVDVDYVAEVQATAPPVGDWPGLWDFCTRRTPLRDPLIEINMQSPLQVSGAVTFGSHHANNTVPDVPPVEVRVIDQFSYEVVVPVVARPSCVAVAVLPNGRTVITNGNHRVVALHQAGHAEVPVLLRAIQSADEFGPTDIDKGLLLNSPRPPTVQDYMDPSVSDLLDLKALNSVLRVAVQTQGLLVPR